MKVEGDIYFWPNGFTDGRYAVQYSVDARWRLDVAHRTGEGAGLNRGKARGHFLTGAGGDLGGGLAASGAVDPNALAHRPAEQFPQR